MIILILTVWTAFALANQANDTFINPISADFPEKEAVARELDSPRSLERKCYT